MTVDERACRFEDHWPGPDERAVVSELLNQADSPHWASCRRYVERFVQSMAQKGYYSSAPREDVVQDSMMSIMKSLRYFRFECKLTTWLRSIVHRRMVDAARFERRRSTWESVSLDVPDGSIGGDGERDVAAIRTTEEECLLREELRDASAHLEEYVMCHVRPERNRQLLDLVLFQGFSIADAAALLGVSSPTASYVVRTARRYVREKMWYVQE